MGLRRRLLPPVRWLVTETVYRKQIRPAQALDEVLRLDCQLGNRLLIYPL
ncbi:hypothetical protein GCM10023194_20890 [Planotetraspora phitsanulokensis]|uniref:Uncharacterized protein n=1 Tax=Planotetraspora phitsanulokensis TaxID=575192 RepID=A0A8J3U6W2_9ACTN|nr:hypothetical protein Pph01_42830 [Planotetraspora phitsanulokensis]